MRFLSYEIDGVGGLAVDTGGGEYRGLLASADAFPGTLDDIVRSGDFAGAAARLKSGAPVDPATAAHRPPTFIASYVSCRNVCTPYTKRLYPEQHPWVNNTYFVSVGHAFSTFCGRSRAGIFKNVTFSK